MAKGWRRQIVAWGLATGVMGAVLGAGYAGWQWVTNFHPTAAAEVASGGSAAVSVPAAVDPGSALGGKLAPDFRLTNQFGQVNSLSAFRGRVVVLSFIDSRCTTVCPLTAVVLKNLMYDLGPYAKDVQLVAVNANPVATSVKAIYDWSQQHNMLHSWQYFTGSPAELKAVWKQYYVSTDVLKGSLVEHIPAVYVIGPNGHERWVYLNASESARQVIGVEVHDLLVNVVKYLPGHPQVTIPPVRELVYLPGHLGPASTVARPFSLQSVMPGGKFSTIRVGSGTRPVLLEFFATWCPDCQEETPALIRLQHLANRNASWPSVVAVDLQTSESSTTHVVHYVQKERLPFPVALDSTGKVSDQYGISGIPTQVLVSPTGHILWYHQGLIGWTSLTRHIKAALAAGGAG